MADSGYGANVESLMGKKRMQSNMTYVCIYWFEVTWNHFKISWFTRNLNIHQKIKDGCHDIFYSTSVWYFIIIWSLTKGKSQETVFHSCIVLAKASYNRISCMCLPHSCWVAIVQHGGHCEWCKKWDHWKWMDVARKHISI